jgi:hypothetical protein
MGGASYGRISHGRVSHGCESLRVCIMGAHLMGRASYRVCILWARISFASLSYAQDTSGESTYIGTKDVLRLLIIGDSAVRLLVTLRAYSA